MPISHRLHSPMDTRPSDGIEQQPKRIVFLSVEGNETEGDYFKYIDKYRRELAIQSIVHIEVLSRRKTDNVSDPQHVYDLLQEYIKIREEGILPKEIYDQLKSDVENNFTLDFITRFVQGKLPPSDKRRVERALDNAKINYDYQKFLSEYKGDMDVFAIIIDRDRKNHSKKDTGKEIRKVLESCRDKGCHCFITNPCFEFWLLLHVCDVRKELSDDMNALLENIRLSNKHTFVSKQLSECTNHGKSINERKFTEFYLHNVDVAIERARSFCHDESGLLDELGTNLPMLFDILREKL